MNPNQQREVERLAEKYAEKYFIYTVPNGMPITPGTRVSIFKLILNELSKLRDKEDVEILLKLAESVSKHLHEIKAHETTKSTLTKLSTIRDKEVEEALSNYKLAHETLGKYVADNGQLQKERDEWKSKAIFRIATWHLIKLGVIKKMPCEKCGIVKSESHHVDYNDPSNIRWLCRKHHFEIHRPAGGMCVSLSIPNSPKLS